MKHVKESISLFFSALFITSTLFAQVSFKDEPPSRSQYMWTGFYAGANAGFVNHTLKMTDNQATSFMATIQETSNYNFSGGLQVGYRKQLDLSSVSAVYGVELSFNFSDTDFNQTYGSPYALYQLSSENSLDTVGLLQAIGGIAVDKTFMFLAAGLSWVNITGSTNNLDSVAFFDSFSMSKKQFGTAVGCGIEYALTEKFSVRLKVDVITPDTYSTSNNLGNTYEIANSIVQTAIGINYKFA